MNGANIISFQYLKSLVLQKENKVENKKVSKSKSEITKAEFLRELRKTLSVLANR